MSRPDEVRPAPVASLRQQMPQTAAFIDELRQAFGREGVDALIRRAMKGGGGFHAVETGPDGVEREFGSRACS